MELKKIQIKNFRSIKDEEILFNHNCLILLGKNEAGKSNVLKAVAAIFEKYKVTDRDRRKKIDNETIDNGNYYVRAIITLNQNDFKQIEELFTKRYNGTEKIIFNSGISLNSFIAKVFKEIILEINISKNSKPQLRYWKYENDDTNLQHPIFFTETNKILQGTGGMTNINNTLFAIVSGYYYANPIKCHYWQYNDSFLLPNSVNIEKFTQNPSDYKALENIFQLCGREDINKEFSTAHEEDGDYANLLEQVSIKVTHTFQKIWKDFKGTSIQFLPDGDQILIKVAEKAKYNFEDRSDGFKKFISILLMLSTPSRVKKIIENDLILIDEPDQSLYPTSAQFLRDELFNIAQKSKVIYTTHSQYMIDSNNLDRHIIVEKKDDITILRKEDVNAPYATDELLRRAVGSSIFECLKPINIIFEGYLDKKLFEKYCQWNKKDKVIKNWGKIYLHGISGVDIMISILDAAGKNFIVVADSDKTSINKRKEFQNNHPDYKSNWLAYADVVSSITTMEDFLTIDSINSEILKLNPNFVYDDTSKNAIQNIDKAVNEYKEKRQNIKNAIIENLKKENIRNEYSQYVDELIKQLNNLQSNSSKN